MTAGQPNISEASEKDAYPGSLGADFGVACVNAAVGLLPINAEPRMPSALLGGVLALVKASLAVDLGQEISDCRG